MHVHKNILRLIDRNLQITLNQDHNTFFTSQIVNTSKNLENIKFIKICELEK